MDGWRIRHGIAGDMSGDVPWMAAGLIFAGGVIATVVHFGVDLALHHHSTKVRNAKTRESHRHGHALR